LEAPDRRSFVLEFSIFNVTGESIAGVESLFGRDGFYGGGEEEGKYERNIEITGKNRIEVEASLWYDIFMGLPVENYRFFLRWLFRKCKCTCRCKD
jgi:hypothetical protein